MGFGAMKGLGIGLQQTAQDWGERLREERKQKYLQGQQDDARAREDKFRATNKEYIEENGKTFAVSKNQAGEVIGREEIRPEKPGKLSDNYVKTKDADGNEVLHEMRGGKLVPVASPVADQQYEAEKVSWVQRRLEELDKNNMFGLRGSDEEDFKDYGGSRANAELALGQEYDQRNGRGSAAGNIPAKNAASKQGTQQPPKASPKAQSSSASPKVQFTSFDEGVAAVKARARAKGVKLTDQQIDDYVRARMAPSASQKPPAASKPTGLLRPRPMPKSIVERQQQSRESAGKAIRGAVDSVQSAIEKVLGPGSADQSTRSMLETAFIKDYGIMPSDNPDAFQQFLLENYSTANR